MYIYYIYICQGFLFWLSELRTWLVSMRMQVWSLALLSGLRIPHCLELQCLGLRCSLDLALPWLWHILEAAARIWALAWELPYAVGAALKKEKKKKIRDLLSPTIFNSNFKKWNSFRKNNISVWLCITRSCLRTFGQYFLPLHIL